MRFTRMKWKIPKTLWETSTPVLISFKMTKPLTLSEPKLELFASGRAQRWPSQRSILGNQGDLWPMELGKLFEVELLGNANLCRSNSSSSSSRLLLQKPSRGLGAAGRGWSSVCVGQDGMDLTVGSPPWCTTPTCPPRSG